MLEYHHYLQITCFLLGAILFRRNWPLQFKLAELFAGITVAIEITGAWLAHTQHQTNGWLYNIYVPVQAGLFWWIIFLSLYLKRTRRFMIWLAAAYAVCLAYCYSIIPRTSEFNSAALTMSLVFYCGFCSVYIFDLLNNEDQTALNRRPEFWIVSGILFFSVLFVCRFSFYNPATLNKEYLLMLDYLVIIANTILYGTIIAGFICLKTLKTTYSPR